MKEQRAAFGLIKAVFGDKPRYLLQYNHKWQWFNLVGGKIEADETPRTTLVRELEEELSLLYLRDFDVSTEPLVLYQTTQFSKREQVLKHYYLYLFAVEFIGSQDQIFQTLSDNPDNLWVDSYDIKRGQTLANKPISDLVDKILQAAGET